MTKANEFFKEKGIIRGLFVVGVLCFLLAPISIFLLDSHYIDKNLHYTADIVSTDNFYDEEARDFQGEIFTRSLMTYRVTAWDGGLAIVENIFDVRTPTGEKIARFEREYAIHHHNGRHVRGYGDRDREGYLWGPKGAAEEFTYWHANYDVPIKMKFLEEEEIEGLKVRKYGARFVADQTQDLTYLPGVPEERGVRVYPEIFLWIEPVTGHMVAYNDRTRAVYYSIKSGADLEPWNTFENKFTDLSLKFHISLAKAAKWENYMYNYIIPFIFILAGIAALAQAKTMYEMRKVLLATYLTKHE